MPLAPGFAVICGRRAARSYPQVVHRVAKGGFGLGLPPADDPEQRIGDHLDWTLDRLAGTEGLLPAAGRCQCVDAPGWPTIVVTVADAARIGCRHDQRGRAAQRKETRRGQLAVRG